MLFFKKKKKEQLNPKDVVVQKIMAPDKINTFRYTYEPWKKANPNKTQLDYEKVICPNNLFDFLTKTIILFKQKFELSPNVTFAIVPIDDAYYKWLDDEKKIDNDVNKNLYINSLSDEEIFERMKVNEWDEEYEIVGIPVYAINAKLEERRKTFYKIEDEVKSDLNSFLENIYGKGNIYIPGYMLTQNDFFKGERDFIQMAKLHFKKNTNVRFTDWEEQRYSNKVALIYPLVIPFAIRRNYTSARLNFDNLLCDVRFSPLVSITKDGLSKFGIQSEDFKSTSMYEKIIEYLGPKTIIMESVVRSCDIPNVNRQILSKLSGASNNKEDKK